MKRLRRNQWGYTAIEVLVAMTLFAIGAAGVISMQRVAVQGNADARRADIATGIAGEWLARLRRDSMSWTAPNTITQVDNRNANTIWLGDTEVTLLAGPPLPPNIGWRQPIVPGVLFGNANTFDVLGREVPQGSAQRFFCVNYRLDWLGQRLDPVTGLTQGNTIRAEVRVFWPRIEQSPAGTCGPGDANVPNAQELYHFVYATTTLRRNAT